MIRCLRLVSIFAACVCYQAANAQAVGERIVKVPVKVTDSYNKLFEREITVTVFETPGRAPYPLLILNHGRPGDQAGRMKMGRVRYLEASRWFASLGYSVWVPTRIGYGVSGADEDPEYTRACRTNWFEPGLAVAEEQTLQVIEHAKRSSDIDGRRIVVAGPSFAGVTSIGVAARNPPGLVAAINISGGNGGDPVAHPGSPCGADVLRKIFSTYGRAARVPTLWIYAENDKYFAPRFAEAWFEAFRSSGGKGEFVMHPPLGEDGHDIFTRGFAQWRPIVERFLGEIK